ncbi:MAG TPA: NADH-quinone oxidoreductase subunit C [Burkholderiaceae bacterium]|nr:NADH-quinone oxidoreductase subunit C [Burkholderiaceae bacterium]
MTSLQSLETQLREALGERIVKLVSVRGELTLEVRAGDWIAVSLMLRDQFKFELAVDLCGVDYADYREGQHEGPRFATVVHLLSVERNCRLRLRAFAPEDDFPVMPSLIEVWPAVGWYEREAFDLFGIIYEGHPDLRRILTDYGFIGHPFRKDFPLSGHVEMRYDPEQRRVIYQPVTIEPREITPRVIREETYGRE